MNMKSTKAFRTEKSFGDKARELLCKRVYILSWLPYYNRTSAICDAVAGVTIGLTIIPQSIAYGVLAGLPPQYGLYSAFMGSILYIIFGTIREVSIGPTSLMALLSLGYCHGMPAEFVVLLGFLAGCVELAMGLLRLGFLVDFISAPVVSGFTSATAVVVMSAQVKGLLGLKYTSYDFMDSLVQLGHNLKKTRPGDACLSLFCLIFLLGLRQIKDLPVKSPRLKRALWFLSISRNALVVVASSIAACLLVDSSGKAPFLLSGKVEPGLPPFSLPPFSATAGNTTYTFTDMCSHFGSALIVVPLVAVLANVAIAKAFSVGAKVDATQEMLTLGLCNIFGSFVRSMPTCGAFTRSAVSNASGVKTPLAGLYSGTLVLLALGFLTPYFYFIPRAALSSVLICAVIFMIDWEILLPLWRYSRRDLIVTVVTFVSSLYRGVEFGILIGGALSAAQLLYRWARPEINVFNKITPDGIAYQLIVPEAGLYFPAVDYLKDKITEAAFESICPIVVDGSNFRGMDYTAYKGIQSLIKDVEKLNKIMIFLNLNPTVLNTLQELNTKVRCCSNEQELITLLDAYFVGPIESKFIDSKMDAVELKVNCSTGYEADKVNCDEENETLLNVNESTLKDVNSVKVVL